MQTSPDRLGIHGIWRRAASCRRHTAFRSKGSQPCCHAGFLNHVPPDLKPMFDDERLAKGLSQVQNLLHGAGNLPNSDGVAASKHLRLGRWLPAMTTIGSLLQACGGCKDTDFQVGRRGSVKLPRPGKSSVQEIVQPDGGYHNHCLFFGRDTGTGDITASLYEDNKPRASTHKCSLKQTKPIRTDGWL